jgi:predicted permease
MFDRKRRERELDDELRAHLAMEIGRRVERGETPEAACKAALKDLGNVALVKEHTRESWGGSALFAFGQDVRYALRLLRKNAALTLTAALSLGLGIGAVTSIFGVFNAVVLRPLPVRAPDRLVVLQPQKNGEFWVLFNPLFEGIRAQQQVLEGMTAVSDEAYLKTQFEGAPAPTYLPASFVSGNYFPLLGLTPAAGRFFREDEDVLPGAAGNAGCPAVIGYRLWKQHPDALGRKIRLRDTDCTIVGVAPSNFESHLQGYTVDIWAPMHQVMRASLFDNHFLAFFSGIIGRLRPGITRQQAETSLTALYWRLQAAEPPHPRGRTVRPTEIAMKLLPGSHGVTTLSRQYVDPLTVLLALAALVLAIASFNTANLLMARGATRVSEFATRAALGAGRGRLVRQLATEAVALALAGGLFGCAIAGVVTPLLASRIGLDWMNIKLDTTPDLRVAGAAIAATLLTALIGGLLPAVRLSRASLQSNLAGAGRTTGGRPARRITGALVVAQLALSLLLLSSTALLVRTISHIAAVDPGFRPDHVVAIDLRDEGPKVEKAVTAALYRTVEQRLNSLPGVASASLSWLGLFGGSDLRVDMIDPDRPQDRRGARTDYVSARYFETTGMRILRGRGFTASDDAGAPRVAVVNETLVRQRYPNREPIGIRLAMDLQDEIDKPFTIVGVVADSKYNDLREDQVEPMIWMPMQQAVNRVQSVMLRVRPGTEAEAARQARAALAATAPLLMIRKFTTLSRQVDDSAGRERLLLMLAAVFGWLALLLAGIGLYGTLACAVAQRTREIGVRLALGAEPRAVLRSIVWGALVYVGCAFSIGLPLAWMAGPALKKFLFGVEPLDLPALGGACIVLLLAAMLAAYLPARRAANIDPIRALRYE